MTVFIDILTFLKLYLWFSTASYPRSINSSFIACLSFIFQVNRNNKMQEDQAQKI